MTTNCCPMVTGGALPRGVALRGRALAVALVVACALPAAAYAAPWRVLVTNDDGISAEGISVLVERLAANRQLEVVVLAPATNQSGTGSRFNTKPIHVASAATEAGHAATSVEGFPADCVLFGVLEGSMRKPDLVVSGINHGQNVGDLIEISGTVGAALTGARMGIPGIAASQGLGPELRFDETADYVARLVEKLRTSESLRRLMRSPHDPRHARVLNVNFPTCTEGKLRGVRAVPLGRGTTVTGYEPDASSPGTWEPTVRTVPYGSNDCSSTRKNPQTDLDAMNNGFAAVTLLDADLANDEKQVAIRAYVED